MIGESDTTSSAPAQADPEPGELVDLHSHVIPGVDDGARDLAEALAMLRIAVADGIGVIVATPHAASCPPERIIPAVAELNEAAAAAGIPIRVLPGSEVLLAPGLPERHAAGQLITLAGTPYILLEIPFRGSWPPFLLQAVYDLQLAGLWPIFAHAERYAAVQAEPHRVQELVARGVPIQINGDSLLGRNGRAARRTAELLIEARMAHLIASDAHRPLHRPPQIREALTRAGDVAGAEYAAWMAAAALAVVRGEPLTLPEPRPVSRPSFFARLRRR